MAVGSYSIADLKEIKFQSVKEFGLDTIAQVIQSELAMHNELMNEMVTSLCEITTDALRIYGTSADGTMSEVDEFGRAPTQKQDFGDTVGFPLRRFQAAVGWNADWFEMKTPADLANALVAVEVGHKKAVVDAIKKGLFRSANYTMRDFLVDYVNVNVKRLVNADSAPIPNGPYGITFDGSTHTHYLANGTLTTAAVDSAISTVMEHGHGEGMSIAINYANAAAFTALSGFVAYLDPRLIPSANVVNASDRLDMQNIYDRALGLYNGAEVIVKPWVPANYCFVWARTSALKPLAFRQRNATALQGLRIPATTELFPLYAEYMQAEFGVGVWNRTNGAVLRFNNASYADPV